MSRIDQLIQEFCPDGVQFKMIGEIFELKNGYTPSKSNDSYWEAGSIPWFRMDDIRTNGRILSSALQQVTPDAVKSGSLFRENSIIISTSATIGEHALIQVPFLANQRFTVLQLRENMSKKLDIKFLFYYTFRLSAFCKVNVHRSGFSGVDMDKFKSFRYPIPPIEVQREIVSILDKFTALEAELEAELEAREAQFRFIKYILIRNCSGETRKLKELIVSNLGGGTPSRSEESYWNGDVPWASIGDISNTEYSIHETRQAITIKGLQNSSTNIVPTGSVVVAVKITPGAMRVVENPIAINQDIRGLILKEEIDPYFLTFIFSEKNIIGDGTIVKSITSSTLEKLEVPVPPMEVQKKIASNLKLMSQLIVELRNELSTRRKQYEYYRGKLLSFKELDAA